MAPQGGTPWFHPMISPQGGTPGWHLRVAPHGGTPWWHPMVAPHGGTPWWHPMVAPHGGTPWWHPRVAPQGGTPGWHPRVVPQGGTPGWYPMVAPHGSVDPVSCSSCSPLVYSRSLGSIPVSVHCSKWSCVLVWFRLWGVVDLIFLSAAHWSVRRPLAHTSRQRIHGQGHRRGHSGDFGGSFTGFAGAREGQADRGEGAREKGPHSADPEAETAGSTGPATDPDPAHAVLRLRTARPHRQETHVRHGRIGHCGGGRWQPLLNGKKYVAASKLWSFVVNFHCWFLNAVYCFIPLCESL